MDIESSTPIIDNKLENTSYDIYEIKSELKTFVYQLQDGIKDSSTTLKGEDSSIQQEQQIDDLKQEQKRKYKKKERKMCGSTVLPYQFKDTNTFHVFGDLCMTGQYEIKLGGSFGWTQLGFDNLKCESIQKFDNFIDVKLRFNRLEEMPLEQLINQLGKIPNQMYQEFSQALTVYNTFIKEKVSQVQDCSSGTVEKYDNSYLEYSDFCLTKIKELTQQYNLCSYCVGRTTFIDGSLDISHIGYSEGFLDLICLDYEMVKQMTLRDRQIQLINDFNEILEHSLICLINRINDSDSFKTRIKITTLDGYDLWIDQTYHKMKPRTYQDACGHFFFCFIELDLDIEQIKGLIEYRNQIYNNKLNLENYLKRELSFYSEDIEYSILSQSFIEKHYQEQHMAMLQQKQQDQNQSKQKICSYRVIKA